MSKVNQKKIIGDSLCEERKELIETIRKESRKNIIEMCTRLNKIWVGKEKNNV